MRKQDVIGQHAEAFHFENEINERRPAFDAPTFFSNIPRLWRFRQKKLEFVSVVAPFNISSPITETVSFIASGLMSTLLLCYLHLFNSCINSEAIHGSTVNHSVNFGKFIEVFSCVKHCKILIYRFITRNFSKRFSMKIFAWRLQPTTWNNRELAKFGRVILCYQILRTRETSPFRFSKMRSLWNRILFHVSIL